MTLIIFLGSLIFTLMLGVPIAFSLLASSVVLMFYLDVFSTQIIAQNLINGANNFSLMAIPFFILTGELMNAGGISKKIIDFAMTLLGHIRGGLGYVTVFASVLFAGLSGSAVAETAALGTILIPMMVNGGYDKARSTGLIASSGIIAPLLPPSVPLILFGVTSGVSITKLFIAGIVPGMIIALGLVSVWWFLVKKDDSLEVLPRSSFKEVLIAFRGAIWALFLPIIILVGLRGGVFTPTEAGVVAVVYALLVGFVVYRELRIKDLFTVLLKTVKTTSVVLFLVSAAMVAAWLITIADIPSTLTAFLEPLIGTPTILLFVIAFIVLLIGTSMDLVPIVLILTPVIMPIIIVAGIDPVYFGVIFILSACIGLLTPPVGTVLHTAAGVSKLNMETIVKAMWPFLLVEILILVLLILFPQLIIVPLNWFT